MCRGLVWRVALLADMVTSHGESHGVAWFACMSVWPGRKSC